MDIERASSMIMALPFISKTIVDDTLYEKVFSFLTLVLSNHSTTEISNLNASCQIFQQIRQACLVNTDQDYRVTTLCIRLLGQFVYYGKSAFFTELATTYPDLLVMITHGITSSEGALRCACIEACQNFVHCPEGSAWLLNNTQATSMIPLALLDQSNYVVSQACQLFSTLLKLNDQALLSIMNPSGLVLSILHPGCDKKQILSALDFCWAIVNIKNQNAMDYIRSKQLFYPMIPLLCSSDRMIRSRVVEILFVLFSWDHDPLKTLNLATGTHDLLEAYTRVVEIAQNIISSSAKKVDTLITAVSLIDASLTLYKRSEISLFPQEPFTALFNLFENYSEKNNLIQMIFRTYGHLIEINSTVVNKVEMRNMLDIALNKESYYTDSRVLKALFTLLTITLHSLDSVSQQDLLKKLIHSLVKMMNENRSLELDYRSLSVVFELINNLLCHQIFVGDYAKPLIETLNNKFLDTEWDIRDAVIHFVGSLFKEPFSKLKIGFATSHNLPLEVFGRIHDSEPYVRASALEVLQVMMKSKEGWEYIQKHQASKDLSSKLPSLLYDTEAFVRRAALDAIISLVQYRACQGMTMEIQESNNNNSLNPQILRKLINDEDIDVRIRACTLIEALWCTQDTTNNFFAYINAGDLLVESANDTNRVVRIEAYRVISNITLSPTPQKDEFTTQFLEKLSTVNMVRLKDSLDFEHLYQEVFDINADMMIQSIVPTNPDDDMNMLDCY